MLMPCDRHRPEDLRLWAELEQADDTLSLRETLIANAQESIRGFASRGSCYVSVSWGKDSVVLADLALRTDPDLPLVWIVEQGIENPYCRLVAAAFCRRDPAPRYVELPCYHDSLARLSDGGRASDSRETPEFRSACRRAERMFGRRIVGIRSEESGRRRISAAVHGIATQRVCRPLLSWRGAEIFAYLAQRRLPVHPNYAMLGGGRWRRDRLRVDCLTGPQGRGMGRGEWEAEYYGTEQTGEGGD